MQTPGQDVFFDNFQVTLIHGPILEETHYYPFGLTMAGIGSKALNFGNPENKIKFQGQEFASKEFSDGYGLEMYEFKYRMDDPQIGRFWQVDPLADKYVYNSIYAFAENKVISYRELEGLEGVLSTYCPGTQLDEDRKRINATPEGRRIAASVWKASFIAETAILAGPQVGVPLILSELSGAPVVPSPVALEATAGSQLSTTVKNAAAGEGYTAEGVDLVVKTRPTWSANQVAQAQSKTEALTNAETVVTKSPVARDPNLRKNFIKNGGQISSTEHLDHTIDLQLGGTNSASNLKPLDASVNTSIGKQLQLQMKNLPDNTRVNRVILMKPDSLK